MLTRSFHIFWNTCSTRANGSMKKRLQRDKQLNTNFSVQNIWCLKLQISELLQMHSKTFLSMIWCVHKTLPVGQAALRTHACSCWCTCKAPVPHTLEGDSPHSKAMAEHLYLWRWGGGVHNGPSSSQLPLAAVLQMESHTKHLSGLFRGGCAASARVLPKYTHHGIDLQHLFWEWQLRATATPGWKWEHSVFHQSNIFCSLQKVIFPKCQCDLWLTKETNTQIN